MFKFSIFIKILLLICFAAILPLIFSNYFVSLTYQDFINQYIAGLETETARGYLESFQQSILIQNFLTFFLVLFIVVIVAILLSKIIIKPIKKLVEGTEEVAKGNFDIKTLIRTGDELEVLATSFNQMVDRLKESYLMAEKEHDRTLGVILNFVDGILVFDEKNTLKIINPKAEKLFGVVDYQEVVGKNLIELKQLPKFYPLINLIGQDKIKPFSKEIFILEDSSRLDKEAQVFEVSTISLLHQNEHFGNLIILHDITREKFIERLKSEFISLAAHQLRTPLSVIKWSLDILLEQEAGKINAEQKELLEKSYASNQKMIMIVDDLLNVTKIEEGRFLGEFSENSLVDLTEEVIKHYQKLLKEKDLKLSLDFPKVPCPKIKIDREKIVLAIQNLIDNALKYNQKGGSVTISLSCDNLRIRFQVKDTGIGIPQAEKFRVFSKFFRGLNTLRLGVAGTGLGLYIVKNIIEAHDGEVGFESEENKGSTFWFTLPIK